MGNRGILHRGSDIVRPYAGRAWITCALRYKDWRQPQWQTGHYTILFFHDEAVSLAAGHRPCALCRRGAYNAYRLAVAAESNLPPPAKDLDRILHQERLDSDAGTGRRRLHQRSWPDLPDGTFVLRDSRPALVLTNKVITWTVDGYSGAFDRPRRGQVDVITPPITLAALRHGYRVQIDDAARFFAGQGAVRPSASGPRSDTEE